MSPLSTVLRRADGNTSSIDIANRTVDVVFATETPVRRRAFDGEYFEVLAVSKDAIDRSRLDDGMSLLDSHQTHSVESMLGSVVPASFRIEAGKAIATVKFSRKPAAEQLLQDISDGHRLPISVGYKILREERTEGERGAVPIIRATRWQPMEISVVGVPADHNAHTRAEEDMTEETTIERTDSTRKLRKAERTTFIRSLLAIGKRAGETEIDDEDLEELVADTRNMNEDQIRSAYFEMRVRQQEQRPTFPHAQVRGMDDRATSIHSAMAEALIYRLDTSRKPSDDSREFVGLSIPEMARRSLELHGMSTMGMSAGQVIQRALHTTSDFSQVISHVGQTTLQAAYAAVPSALKAVGHQSTIRDFKLKHAVRLSGFSDLEKVNEHGEFKRGTFEEGGESYRLDTWGKVFGMTRQMLVNDELGAFATVSTQLGAAARRREADLLAGLVMANPKMADGKALFHVDHNNLGTAAALSEESLSAARLAMSKQTGLAGELIDVTPRFLVVGLDLQTKAEKLLTAIQATTTADVNVFANRLQLVVDRRLTNPTAWYIVASPSEVPGLEYAYLEGEPGPQFMTREGFDIDGVEIKVRLDFGAGFLDHRGWYMNPGQ